jgi:CheY-like chemotaxis protein
MTVQALLVSRDDSASEILGRTLPIYGVAVERWSDPSTAITRLQQQKFDALVVDFDDPEAARDVIREARLLGSTSPPVTVALVADPAAIREILSAGAHFVLHKPLTEEKARTGLCAVTALLSRERRRAFRVPVQAPVALVLPDQRKIEGILLDLSETGMDVLTAEPQPAGSLIAFRFQLPDSSFEMDAHGQVAWANPNGQTGVHFLDLTEVAAAELKAWLRAAAMTAAVSPNESVPHGKLTDLSLGGCYVETTSPFPERSLIDLCLKAEDIEIHTEAMVRVVHPGRGMGVEFPSRTREQRAQVENLIRFLRGCPETTPELFVSPRALTADLSQFEPSEAHREGSKEEMEDLLLELLRRGTELQEDDFIAELRHQRSSENALA